MISLSGAPAAAEILGPPAEAGSEVDSFRGQVDDLVSKNDVVLQLERRVGEVLNFYDGKKHGSEYEMGLGKLSTSKIIKKKHVSARRKANGGRRTGQSRVMPKPNLVRQFGVIIREITSYYWAWPFLKPVDVKALQLDDYYKIITKPMDFSTIEKKIYEEDGTKYSSVREIYSDVRLVCTNAMKYYDEQNEIHLMAKALLERFEEEWLHFLPKVESEEKREKEEPKNIAPTNTSQEASIAKLAEDRDMELNEQESR